jgi:peroxiredoxin Q/BCP
MQPGDLVEDFTLPDQHGNEISLSQFSGSPVILFFYPRADTPGCTIEACGFRDHFAKLRKAGVIVLGISRDTVAKQRKFATKYDIQYPLLADSEMELIKRYDLLKEKKMYGKPVTGVARTTYLIGPDRKLIHVFENVKPEGHAEEVLSYLKK